MTSIFGMGHHEPSHHKCREYSRSLAHYDSFHITTTSTTTHDHYDEILGDGNRESVSLNLYAHGTAPSAAVAVTLR